MIATFSALARSSLTTVRSLELRPGHRRKERACRLFLTKIHDLVVSGSVVHALWINFNIYFGALWWIGPVRSSAPVWHLCVPLGGGPYMRHPSSAEDLSTSPLSWAAYGGELSVAAEPPIFISSNSSEWDRLSLKATVFAFCWFQRRLLFYFSTSVRYSAKFFTSRSWRVLVFLLFAIWLLRRASADLVFFAGLGSQHFFPLGG